MTTPEIRPDAVVGLVLTLSRDEAARASAFESLGRQPGVRLGQPAGPWLPISAETGDPEGLHERLARLPGVIAVDVAFIEVVDRTAPTASDPVQVS